MSKVLIPSILCGGAGSRLWPVSREQHPKPFMRMADGRSLLQKAFLRGAGLPKVAEILTITNRELLFKAEDDYREVNSTGLPTRFILEPFGRNTAAAAAAAALQIAEVHGDEALMLVLAADHLIADEAAFAQAVAQAVQIASAGQLVTFGIRPDTPETGYGYIEAENNKVLRFVEKPSLEVARDYVNTGRFYWNSGMFCFSAGSLLREMTEHCSELLDAVRTCMNASRVAQSKGYTQLELDRELFAVVPDISIDYAVMEKSSCVSVVPCDIGWNDIGSWTAMGSLGEQDAVGNTVEGSTLLHNVSNCYIRSEDRLIGA